jgi:hypothetical protein
MPPFPPCQAALILSLQLISSLHFSFKFRRMMEIEDHVEIHRLFTQALQRFEEARFQDSHFPREKPSLISFSSIKFSEMKPVFPSPTPTWHNDTYSAIDPTLPSLSHAGQTVIITGAVSPALVPLEPMELSR